MATQDKSSRLYKLRHSCSHVLAQAVMQMFPEAKLGIGPPIENGFYYDFDLPRTLIPEDLAILEEKMRAIIKEAQPFTRREEPIKKALEFLKKAAQPYKIDLVKELADEGVENVSFYQNADKSGHVRFADLCEGNHTENTSEIKAFKLLHIAGAYWRGSEKNKMLQRIYGTCFETEEELQAYLKQLEEAKKRDHRKLGRELELFLLEPDLGGGLPLWMPKGALVRDLLIEFLKKEQIKRGYKPVISPHISKLDLYKTSGHWQNYRASMYSPIKIDSEEYLLKPMNCPSHIIIYRSKMHSYRELPVRLAEFGTVYRYEQSGELNGLVRVRGFTQDDAHIFCRPDQVKREFLEVLDLVLFVFKTFGFENYRVRIGVRDPEGKKYIGSDELWEKAESEIEEAVKEMKMSYSREEGDAAFYGPKLDFMVKDAIGREWQLGTIQIDYNLPERFELEYTGDDGKPHRPVMIHRAPFGSLERFIGILIEHYGGAFPLWLAPVQMRILPVSDNFLEYAHIVEEILVKEGYRVEVDDNSEMLGKKIRNAELQKIPYMIVVGEKETQSQTIAVRSYHTKKQEVLKIKDFVSNLCKDSAFSGFKK